MARPTNLNDPKVSDITKAKWENYDRIMKNSHKARITGEAFASICYKNDLNPKVLASFDGFRLHFSDMSEYGLWGMPSAGIYINKDELIQAYVGNQRFYPFHKLEFPTVQELAKELEFFFGFAQERY